MLLVALAVIGLAEQQSVLELASFEGNVDAFAVGNTMAEAYVTPPYDTDGLACKLQQNTAVVPTGALSSRALLLKAYLYYSGNLYQKSAMSPAPTDADIDDEVSLQLPGESAAKTFHPEKIYRAPFNDNALGSPRTSYFYTARVDITEALKTSGKYTGTYTFSGFESNICPDEEDPYCDPQAVTPPSCLAPPYVVATRSFFIVLVFSDPALPPHSLKIFDGLELLDPTLNAHKVLSLSGVRVAPIPRGSLTLYTIEGDVNQDGDTLNVDAGRGEQLVGNDVETQPPPLTAKCGDPSLPNNQQNIMDSSIVVDPSQPKSSVCVRGLDIDTFNLGPYLQGGDTHVDVHARTTKQDKFGIIFAALGLDVFRPVISTDSRKQIVGDFDGTLQPKTTVTYRIGISNTGNVPATGVRVTDELSRFVGNLEVTRIPEGATDTSTATGGNNNVGRIDVQNITIQPGDIAEIRYKVDVTCPVADNAVIQNTAVVYDSAEGARGATLVAPSARVVDPEGDICAGRRQPNVPSGLPEVLLDRRLLGGAGCQQSEASAWLLPLLALALLSRKRRGLALLFVLGVSLGACQNATTPEPDDPQEEPEVPTLPQAPSPRSTTEPGISCAGKADMVQTAGGACIDRFESTLSGALGNPDQSSGADGSTAALAEIKYGSTPTSGVSYYQAEAACKNAGKRLCTIAEWETACRGSKNFIYPYGDTFDTQKCNGFDSELGETVQAGAMTQCTSDAGAFDMSGNLAEWIVADLPLITGQPGKELRGGSFVGNAAGLSCTNKIAGDPKAANARAGVRCCL